MLLKQCSLNESVSIYLCLDKSCYVSHEDDQVKLLCLAQHKNFKISLKINDLNSILPPLYYDEGK